ncbi:MAG: hypothetical protein ACK5V3_16760 [Bdellovibrionales bacterium]
MKSVIIVGLFLGSVSFANPPATAPAATEAKAHSGMGHTGTEAKAQTKEAQPGHTATKAKATECKNKAVDGKCMDDGAMKK